MMRLLIGAGLSVLCLAHPAAAEPQNPSLFFTPEEVRTVEALMAKTRHPGLEAGDIHLGAVLYYAPDDWVVWLQNRRWTPATQSPDLRVVDVQPDQVTLSVASLAGTAARRIILKPHQTFQLSTGAVVEGGFAASPVADPAR